MFQMDEKLFAELQKVCCWFTLPIFEDLPNIDPCIDIMNKAAWNDDILVQRHIFAMIFGGYGYSVNLSKAKALATIKLGQIEKQEPKDKSPNSPDFVIWIGLYAQYNILLGTVFAYLQNYPLAAFLLMNGLKTRAVNLSMPYCDFIKYVLSKVAEMPVELAEYSGCGFSVDDPMGSIEMSGGNLIANAAETIISSLAGDNGEIILSYCGGQKYGNLKRLGSTNSKDFRHCIDIYEVLIIDRKFKVKKLNLYFNGYFTIESKNIIRLPKGFHLDPLSEVVQLFQIVD